MVLNFTAERETEIAVIMQLAKAKTEIHGEQQITEEASWAHGAGLRQSRRRATQALLVCLGVRGTGLSGKTVEGRHGELRENNLAERPELKDGGDLPGGPVTKTPHSKCWGPGFDPWSGN